MYLSFIYRMTLNKISSGYVINGKKKISYGFESELATRV